LTKIYYKFCFFREILMQLLIYMKGYLSRLVWSDMV